MIDLEGKFFHIFNWQNKIGEQGLVKGYDPTNNTALVLLLSWPEGYPNHQYLKKVTNDWVFYETAEEMREAWIVTLPYEKQDHVRKMEQWKNNTDNQEDSDGEEIG